VIVPAPSVVCSFTSLLDGASATSSPSDSRAAVVGDVAANPVGTGSEWPTKWSRVTVLKPPRTLKLSFPHHRPTAESNSGVEGPDDHARWGIGP
jgi:hypothetical protein